MVTERERTDSTAEPCKHAYTAFGLRIASVVPIGSFSPTPLAGPLAERNLPDVTITWGAVPEALENATARSAGFEAGGNELLLRPQGGPRILVRAGCAITVDPTTLDRGPRLESWLSTSALGALLHQRGLFPLHASAIVLHDEVVLFTGDRGAGKSTLMSALAQRGYPCAADDVVAVTLGTQDDALPRALPGLTRAKLWPESAAMLGIDVRDCPQVEPDVAKHFVAWPSAAEYERRIRAIYVLQVDDGNQLAFEQLSPLQAVEAVITNLYRPQYASALGMTAHSLRTVTSIVRHTPLTRIRRPAGSVTLPAIAEHVLRQESSNA